MSKVNCEGPKEADESGLSNHLAGASGSKQCSTAGGERMFFAVRSGSFVCSRGFSYTPASLSVGLCKEG